MADGSLDPQGPAADSMADLWWLMLSLGVAVFIIFAVVLAVGLFRRRPPEATQPGGEGEADPRRFHAWMIGAGVAGPLVIIAIVFGATVHAMRGIETAAPAGGPGDRCRRSSVVVGGPLPRGGDHHRQRDPHAGRSPGGPPAHLGRRHPQLLGAGAGREARHVARQHQHPDPRGGRARGARQPLRRVLRAPAHPDDDGRGGRGSASSSPPGSRPGSNRRRSRPTTRLGGGGTSSSAPAAAPPAMR